MTYNEIIQKVGKRITKHVYYIKNNVTTNVSDDNIDKIKFDTQTPLIGTSINGCELTLKEKIDGDIYVQIVARYQQYQDTKTYGPFNLKEEPKYDASKKTYLHKTFDSLLKSMVDYQPLNITYPCTVYSFFTNLVSTLGYTNNIQSLPNGEQLIPFDIYNNIGFTYRDVLNDIAVANGVLFYIDINEIKIATLGNNPITIDDDILKNQNIDFGEHYGPINSIVLSRSGESDNVYIWDEESILQNGMHEFKIVDNQLMNENNRSDYLPKLLEQLDNIEYDIYDTELVGFGELYPLQSVTFNTNNKTYNSYIFNNEITLTTGYKQAIYNDMPEQSETDYKSADKTDKKINQAYIIVRKNTAEIEALTSTTQIISNEITHTNQIQLENAYKGSLHYLSIKGQMSLLYPSDDLYPADDLYPLDSYLLVDNNKVWLDINYLNYINNNVCDEFVYEDGKCKIIRRVGETSTGVLFPLENEVIEERQDALIEVNDNSIIKMESFDNLIYSVKYLLQNNYTDTFAPSIDLISKINLSPGNVLIEASKLATITAEKIDLTGKEIDLTGDDINIKSNNFEVDKNGKIKAKAGEIGGFNLGETNFSNNINGVYNYSYYDLITAQAYITNQIVSSYSTKNIYDYNNDGTVSAEDLLNIQKIILGIIGNEKIISGRFEINSTDPKNCLTFYSGSNEKITSIGINGINGENITGRNLILGNPDATNNDYTKIIASGDTGVINCVSVVQTSLANKKKNFEKLENAIKIIKNIDIYKYNMKEENNNCKKHIGFVIGDKYRYSKEVTSENNDGVNIYSFVSLCCKAIQEQQEEIDMLKKEMEEIKNGFNRI